jgi:hypothetical protein
MRGFEEDVEQLQSAVEGMDGSMGELSHTAPLSYRSDMCHRVSDASPSEDEELERFRAAPNKSQYLKALPVSAVLSLYMKAKEDFQTEMANVQAEMEDQIRVCPVLRRHNKISSCIIACLQRLCPPRSTRSFQIIRVVDAVTSRYPQLREAQLQVWDAKMLGEKMLQEGSRYQVRLIDTNPFDLYSVKYHLQVSNLIPAQQKAWVNFRDKGQIYLSTSKATTWKRRDD